MTSQMMQIEPGTPVYNSQGERLGRVVYCHQGIEKPSSSAAAEDTQEMEMPIGPEAYELFDRFELSLELREQLFSRGFVKVEASRSGHEQYFLPEQLETAGAHGLIIQEAFSAHAG